MTPDPHAQLQVAEGEAHVKLRNFLRPYLRRAAKLGFRPFFKVEPEMIVANGTVIPVRCVTIKLVPESPRAKSGCTREGAGVCSIQAEDRYVDLKDAEACIAGAFEEALTFAKAAV